MNLTESIHIQARVNGGQVECIQRVTDRSAQLMIQMNPLATPGFFEQAAIPLGGSSILPGTLPQDILSLSGGSAGPGRPDMVTSVMADMMKSMQELQASFSMYMGGGFR